MMILARFRFPVLAEDTSVSAGAVAFVLDLEERVETATAVGGLGTLFGGMVEVLCIGVVRVVGLLVVMVIDKRTRGSNYLISNPQKLCQA